MNTSRRSARHGNAYEIFILVLTLFSLLLMVLAILPLDDQTLFLVQVYDNTVCVIFLADFFYNLASSRPRSDYFFGQRGWLDLLGSIPALGFFRFTALFRLARLSRLLRTLRMLRGQAGRELIQDVIRNRGSYASFVTILAAGIVLSLSSIVVLELESHSLDSNIKDGGDALWWGVVTITTVGYGDRFPVTALGRMVGVLVMFAGVGIIGSLASILASFLVSSPEEEAADAAAVAGEPTSARSAVAVSSSTDVAAELARLSGEVAALRQQLALKSE